MSISHVLVVDDEADIRALIQDILSDEGYGVTVAADAAEARAARAEKKFDGIEGLQAQIAEDSARARDILAKTPSLTE